MEPYLNIPVEKLSQEQMKSEILFFRDLYSLIFNSYMSIDIDAFEVFDVHEAVSNMSDLAKDSISVLQKRIHESNVKAGWYSDLHTGERIERNVGEMIALMHSELSEALEGYRKNLQDTHLPHRRMMEVEFADAIIRIIDTAEYLKMDLAGAIREKRAYNKTRQDHKRENRLKENGVKF